MATRAWALKVPAWGGGDQLPPGTHVVEWVNLDTGDDGAPFPAPNYPGKSVSVEGTLSGSTVTWQGREDALSEWFTLHDTGGADLAFTAAGKKQVLEDVVEVRPVVAGGAAADLIGRLIVTTTARR